MTDPALPVKPRMLTGAKLLLIVLGLLLATAAVMGACSALGIYKLTAGTWELRMIRLITAAVTGAALAAAGMALQALLRNPLADPYILGISSGAGVGVLLAPQVVAWLVACSPLLAGQVGALNWFSTPLAAMVGGLVTSGVVYGIAQRRGRLNPYVLLLSGAIVNVFNGALSMLLMYVMRPDKQLAYIQWGMGAVAEVWQPHFYVAIGLVALGWLVLVLRGAWFNAMGLGDDVAQSSGVPVHYLRAETFVLAAVMTAAAVSLAGPIGFVGLIVPHICRLVVGADHRVLGLVSGFVGAMFLMIADTVARTSSEWTHLGDLPVGIITAMAGGPFFVFLLRRRLKGALA